MSENISAAITKSDVNNSLVTRLEKKTLKIRERIFFHFEKYWGSYSDNSKYSEPDLRFVIEDEPHQIWSIYCSNKSTEKEVKVYFLWNGQEIISFETDEQAYQQLINEKKNKRIESVFKYWTATVTVSAILAFSLLIFIVGLSVFDKTVPAELWTVFTAVISFYFGRGSSTSPGPPDAEVEKNGSS